MTNYQMIFRSALILGAATSMVACASNPGASFGGANGGANLGYAPPSPKGTQGCLPQSGAVGGIETAAVRPSSAGTIGTATSAKPERASSTKPTRATSGSDHAAGAAIQSSGSGC